jgi:hypothetical protein
MNKQALLDCYIHDNKGKWQSSHENLVYTEKHGFFYSERITGYPINWFVMEFVARAKNLGYINGYRWGVEYLTNGKKPDLPEDTSVQVRNDIYAFWTCGQVGGLSWSNVFKFRITDERYKPADTIYLSVSDIPESMSNTENVSVDQIAQAKKEFARMSTAFQDLMQESFDKVIARMEQERKSEAERQLVVDAAFASLSEFNKAHQVLRDLYDLGFLRMPESK